MASRNGMQRLTVRLLLVADACCLSTAEVFGTSPARRFWPALGSAMTPWSSGLHRKRIEAGVRENETSASPAESSSEKRMRHEFIPRYIPYSPRARSSRGPVRGRARIFAAAHKFLGPDACGFLFSEARCVIYGAHDYGRAVDRLGFLIHDSARLLRKRFEAKGSAYGLSAAQWRSLVRLVKEEGVAQARLAELLEIEPISASRLLDRMEEGGWIERRQDASRPPRADDFPDRQEPRGVCRDQERRGRGLRPGLWRASLRTKNRPWSKA